MQEPLQENLAKFIAQCDWEKIPEHFKEDARYRVLDWVGCAVAGAHYPQKQIAKQYIDSLNETGECTVIGERQKYSPRSAAYLNGIAGHVCELDDGHRTAIGHPGSITVPTALAMAEKTGATGTQFLKAVILGYDVFARLGRCVNPSHYRTWHTTGTCGTMAACATAASLLGLTAEQTNDALGIACTSAGGLVDSFGTLSKATNIALACQNGIDAASLAKLGLTGSHSALAGPKGFLIATSADPHLENLENPSEENLVSDTAFYKVYSSCGHTNTPLDVINKIHKETNFDPRQVEKIVVKTYKVSVDLTSHKNVSTQDSAKFSTPYCFAILLLKGSVSLANFEESVRKDPGVTDLMNRVTVEEDPEATANFPRRQAEVIVTMKDGTVHRAKTLDSCDKADNEQIIAKFNAALPFWSEQKRKVVVDFITHVDKLPCLTNLAALLV